MTVVEHPILFSTEMVRAILDDRKTMTRRVIRKQPAGEWAAPGRSTCPYGQPGGGLWVRETFALRQDCEPDTDKARHYVMYRADGSDPADGMNWHDYGGKWKPSIFMPRWASRITLELTGVRVERLQEISEDDAISEGVRGMEKELSGGDSGLESAYILNARNAFSALWDTINARRGFSWETNPWVWVLTFKRLNAATKE